MNASMYELAKDYKNQGMSAYTKFQKREFELEQEGYQALKHQSFVGAGYFDELVTIISEGRASTHSLKGSTEEHQFTH